MNYGFNIWYAVLAQLTAPKNDGPTGHQAYRETRFYQMLVVRQELDEEINDFRTSTLALINRGDFQANEREFRILTLLFLDQIPHTQEGYGDTVEEIRSQYRAILSEKPLPGNKHLQSTFIAVCQNLRIQPDMIDDYGRRMFSEWKA